MLDPVTSAAITQGVLHGVTSLTTIAAKDGASAAGKAIFSRVFSKKDVTLTKSLLPFEQTILTLNPQKEDIEALNRFLRSETFANILRSLTAIAKGKTKNSRAVAHEAVSCYIQTLFPDAPTRVVKPFVDELLELCDAVIEEAWETAVASEIIPANWQPSDAAQAIIADEFDSLTYHAARIGSLSRKTLDELDPFLIRYRRQVGARYSKLRPQTLQETVEIPIDKLYIVPSLIAASSKNEVQTRDEMLQSAYRVVLLGNPGGGKSTFAAKLCFDLCQHYAERKYGGRQLTPIFIILREFSRYRKEHPCSILEFITLQARSELQLSDVPPDAFLLLLLNGHSLMIFDGLDELTDTQDRLAIKNAVENFASEFPSVPIVVTSREIGYEQAPLDRTRFTLFKLAPFDEDQVKEYASKWFSLTRHTSEEDKAKICKSFLAESQIVPDIRTNPLMLGLLCNLYRQDGFLPKNRPDVYQRCADLLFTKWDRHRGISIQLPMDHKLKPAMGYLANWIHSDQSLQEGVTERQLVHATATYLSTWKEEWDEAESIASKFVEFFKGRAWVFSDTGSSQSESLYQFTHRTFLEYFTAEHLVKVYSTAQKLHMHLIPHVAKREWDVVCQVAYQMNAQRTDSHDELVELLLESSRQGSPLERLGILSFCARTLELLYPTPAIRRKTIRQCVDFLLYNVELIVSNAPESDGMVTAIAFSLLTMGAEIQNIHANEIKKALDDFLLDFSISNDKKASGILLAEQFPLFLHASDSHEGTAHWATIMDDIWRAHLGELKRVSIASSTIAAFAWAQLAVPAEELVAAHGVAVLIHPTVFPVSSWFRNAIIESVASTLAFQDEENNRTTKKEKDWSVEQAPYIVDIIIKSVPIDCRREQVLFFQTFDYPFKNQKVRWPTVGPLCELIFLYLALQAEFNPRIENVDPASIKNIFRRDAAVFSASRSRKTNRTTALRLVEKYCTSIPVIETLRKWVDGELLFLDQQQPSRSTSVSVDD